MRRWSAVQGSTRPLSTEARSDKVAAMSGSANHPPELPEISDEAGDTPSWVPRLGLALFLLFVGWVVFQHGHAGGADAGADTETADP